MEEQKNDTWLYIGGGLAVLVIIFLLIRRRSFADPINNIPGTTATSSEWIQWHKDLLAYGIQRTEANRLFMQAFNKYGVDKGYANNNELRNYAGSQGFTVPAYSVGSGVYDTVANTGSALDKGIAGIGSAFMIGVVIVIAMAGFVMYKLFSSKE